MFKALFAIKYWAQIPYQKKRAFNQQEDSQIHIISEWYDLIQQTRKNIQAYILAYLSESRTNSSTLQIEFR